MVEDWIHEQDVRRGGAGLATPEPDRRLDAALWRAAARFGAAAVLPAAYLLAGTAAAVCGFWPDLAPLVAGIGVAAVAFQVLKVVADAMVLRFVALRSRDARRRR